MSQVPCGKGEWNPLSGEHVRGTRQLKEDPKDTVSKKDTWFTGGLDPSARAGTKNTKSPLNEQPP